MKYLSVDHLAEAIEDGTVAFSFYSPTRIQIETANGFALLALRSDEGTDDMRGSEVPSVQELCKI